MAKIVLRSAFLGLAAILAASPVYSWEEERLQGKPEGGAMVVDSVVVRPLGLAATVFGSAAFFVSLPFSLMAGNADEAADALVGAPARFTFERPLGYTPRDEAKW